MKKETKEKMFRAMNTLSFIALLAIGPIAYAANSQSCAPTNWTVDKGYAAGNVINYQGHNYEVVQSHFAFPNTNWIPAAGSIMWKDLGACMASKPLEPATIAEGPTSTASSNMSGGGGRSGGGNRGGGGGGGNFTSPTMNNTMGSAAPISQNATAAYAPQQAQQQVKETPRKSAATVASTAALASPAIMQQTPTTPAQTLAQTQALAPTPTPTPTPTQTQTQAPTPTQTQTLALAPAQIAPPGVTAASPGLPTKIVGGYWPYWVDSPIRIRDINVRYNLIYLFHARPVGGPPGTTGAVMWTPPGNGRGAATNFVADIQYARTVQGRKIILSVGGAGNGMSFPNRTKSQTFVNSIVSIYNQFGGFDGIDWNTFEADQNPDTAEMIWISLELKRLYPGFIITSPPAPWNPRDMTFCQAMVNAGAMDYAAPQYYDGPGLNDPSYVVQNVNQWISMLGPTHVVIGFGVWDALNYMTSGQASLAWNQVWARHPTIRGGFNWQIHTDEAAGWPFANNIGLLINPL
ncbi:MAG: glycosyl hydrolase family 18 protein [Pseudomonadota bacterium]